MVPERIANPSATNVIEIIIGFMELDGEASISCILPALLAPSTDGALTASKEL